jgi:hypothetical protein
MQSHGDDELSRCQSSLAVERGTDLPDLTIVPDEHADASHPDNGVREVPSEPPRGGAQVRVDDPAHGVAAGERGVGGDDASPGPDVEDAVVEARLAAAVRLQPRVHVPRREPGLELRQERRRDRWVGPAPPADEREVVQPVLHEEARRRAHRLCRREQDEVAVAEPARGEPRLLGSTIDSCWDRPSIFCGIDRRLLLRSTVGSW